MLLRVRVCAAACVGVFVGACLCCDCRLTVAAPRLCRPRAQGWLRAQRLCDTGHNRAVARGHRWCAGAGAVGGGRALCRVLRRVRVLIARGGGG